MKRLGSGVMLAFGLAFAFAFSFAACGGSATSENDGSTKTAGSGATCSETAGATWSVEKSRFAFGGAPVQDGPNHWTGPEGAASGPPEAMAIPNSGAPARDRPDFSADSATYEKHVKEYLVGFGIEECQIAGANVLSSGGGGGPVGGPYTAAAFHNTIRLSRAIDGIPVVDSRAYATINDQDQSTSESVSWPALDANLVATAKAFRDRLKDPAKLAEYKSRLPTDFQLRNDGAVTIHHPPSFGNPQRFYVAYDAMTNGSMAATLSFDVDGNRVDPW